MDTAPLRDAYRALLDAAAAVADAGPAVQAPPPGEWDADRILAHVSILGAAALAAAGAVASGANTTYDNRLAHDPWTLAHVTELAGGNAGLRMRVGAQAEALCALGGPMLSEAELDTPVPTLLVSHDTLQLDRPVPLRDLLTGLARSELPGHTRQLLDLLPATAAPAAAAGAP